MVNKLLAVKSQMFEVTYEVREITITVPAEDEESEATEITVKYVECTVHPFNEAVILTAFGIDPSAQYGQFSITYGQAIANMANALRRTLGGFGSGLVPPITDAELAVIIANLNTTPQRQALVTAALSLVGRVPYFWGGKSAAGWNNEWNTPRVVTSIGSSTTGTLRPFGLDCTGYTDWVYKTALGVSIGAGSWNQWDMSAAVNAADLLPGDLGFYAVPGTAQQHVLIYIGRDSNGNKLWAHSAFGSGVILNSPPGVNFFRRPQGIDWED
jgi:cell wall-associated NlpC family hydrolase